MSILKLLLSLANKSWICNFKAKYSRFGKITAFGIIVYIIDALIKELIIAGMVFLKVLFKIHFGKKCSSIRILVIMRICVLDKMKYQ